MQRFQRYIGIDYSGGYVELSQAEFADGDYTDSDFFAARAQVMFDCWMQEQEENFQTDHIAACRNRFFAALEEVQKAVEPPAPSVLPVQPVKKEPMPAPRPAPAAPSGTWGGPWNACPASPPRPNGWLRTWRAEACVCTRTA